MAIEKVKEYFKKYGIEERVQEFDVSSATVDLAAKALGCEPCRIGISNIQRCARKYMGDIDIVVTDTNEGKKFSLTVMMNGKQFTPKTEQFTPNV